MTRRPPCAGVFVLDGPNAQQVSHAPMSFPTLSSGVVLGLGPEYTIDKQSYRVFRSRSAHSKTTIKAVEPKPVGQLPWQPQSEIRGNLAIGNLRENLQRFLRNERGVHAETLLTAVGALVGFASQNAALIRAAEVTSVKGCVVPWDGVALFGDESGERHLAGNWINAHLHNEVGSIFPLWGFIAAAAIQSGAASGDLADTGEMARHVTQSFGRGDYGKLRAPTGHEPALQPNELVKRLWAATCQIFRLPLPMDLPLRQPPQGLIQTMLGWLSKLLGRSPRQDTESEPPLDEIHWPIILSMAAAQFLQLTKDVLNPRISFALVMESAIISSKIDPERIEPGKWDIRAAAGGLAVRRIRN
jgi:hypothetical protein